MANFFSSFPINIDSDNSYGDKSGFYSYQVENHASPEEEDNVPSDPYNTDGYSSTDLGDILEELDISFGVADVLYVENHSGHNTPSPSQTQTQTQTQQPHDKCGETPSPSPSPSPSIPVPFETFMRMLSALLNIVENNKGVQNHTDDTDDMGVQTDKGHGHDMNVENDTDHGNMNAKGVENDTDMDMDMDMDDHGNLTADLMGAYATVGSAIGINIEGEFQALYNEHVPIIRDTKSGTQEREDAHNRMLAEAKVIAAKIIEAISAYIEQNKDSPEFKEFMDAVAIWLKNGLHSSEENGEGTNEVHGIHSLATGSAEDKRAFQMAHVMNAGNDTIIGQMLRNSEELDNLTGESLQQFIDKNGGNFADLFRSKGKTQNGEDSVVAEGEISTFYGASGSASVNAQQEFGMGARQNLFGHADAWV